MCDSLWRKKYDISRGSGVSVRMRNIVVCTLTVKGQGPETIEPHFFVLFNPSGFINYMLKCLKCGFDEVEICACAKSSHYHWQCWFRHYYFMIQTHLDPGFLCTGWTFWSNFLAIFNMLTLQSIQCHWHRWVQLCSLWTPHWVRLRWVIDTTEFDSPDVIDAVEFFHDLHIIAFKG